MKYATELEAVYAWVNEFNAIENKVLLEAIGNEWDEWEVLEDVEDDGVPEWPMWGWLWSFYDSADESWAWDHEKTLLDIGFTIIKNESEGWFYIGINGAGFDFYDAFWLPLYRARVQAQRRAW